MCICIIIYSRVHSTVYGKTSEGETFAVEIKMIVHRKTFVVAASLIMNACG